MITNREVNRFRETIFANNNKNIRRGFPMAGRKDELTAYRAVFEAGGRRIVTMSGLLGSGKTFFLNAARQHLNDTSGFPEIRNAHQINASHGGETVEELVLQFRDADPAHPCILELEELDRKGEFQVLMIALRAALEWLRTTRDGMLVITGDQFLAHPEVRRAVHESGGDSEIPVTPIDLAPLDRKLFLQALELRLGLLAEHVELILPDEVFAAAADILSEPLVERTLLPPTRHTIANFREAFGLLMSVSGVVNRYHDSLRISAADLSKVAPKATVPRNGEMGRVDEEVLGQVRKMLESGTLMEPLETEDIKVIAGSTMSGRDLFVRLIQPLVTGQVLEPLGISYFCDGSTNPDTKYVGPFLPRQKTLLRVVRTLSEAS